MLKIKMRVKVGIETWGGTEGKVEKRSIYLHCYLTHLARCDDKFDVDNYQSAGVSFTKQTFKHAIEDVQVVTLHRLHNV